MEIYAVPTTENGRQYYQSMMENEGLLIQAHIDAVTKFKVLALQGAFVLNGTVGVAAFIQLKGVSLCPVVICGVGALFAVFASVAALFEQYKLKKYDIENHKRKLVEYFRPDLSEQLHKIEQNKPGEKCSIMLLFCSLACFFFWTIENTFLDTSTNQYINKYTRPTETIPINIRKYKCVSFITPKYITIKITPAPRHKEKTPTNIQNKTSLNFSQEDMGFSGLYKSCKSIATILSASIQGAFLLSWSTGSSS